MVKRGWDAHVLGIAPHHFKDAVTAVKTLRVSQTMGLTRLGYAGAVQELLRGCARAIGFCRGRAGVVNRAQEDQACAGAVGLCRGPSRRSG